MIKRLRWKIVGIIMLTVLLMLLGIFGAFFSSVSRNIARDSEQVLHRVMLEGEMGRLPALNGAGDIQMPYFCVSVSDGTATVLSGGYFDLKDTQLLLEIINACMDKEADSGLLPAYGMRYLRTQTPRGTRIAFVDTSLEGSTIRHMLLTSLWIGLLTLALVFLLSLCFANWAVRPVERTLRQQRRFVADASHELKTPLTVILANTELLRSSEEAEQHQQERWLENIHSEAQRMKRLVEEMLSLIRTENVPAGGSLQRLNFSELLLDSILLFEPVAFEEGKRLEYEVEEELYLQGNADQLRQLCGILLDNAVKYAPAGSSIRLQLRGGKQLNLTVSNPGPAIAPEELAHLFDRFYRGDEARSGDGSFGLGLSIAAAIVQQHRGRIRAESEENCTTFRVELPKSK